MTWNITKEPLYQEALEEEFARKMRGVNFRKSHLHDLQQEGDAEIIKKFPGIVEHWADGKAFDHLEKFFKRLLSDGRFEAHKACIQALTSEIMKKPESMVKLFTAKKHFHHAVVPNPLITRDDDFKLLCVYSILQPTVLLTKSEILSGEWSKGIEKPENSDITFATLSLIGYRAYGFLDSAPYEVKTKIRVEATIDMLNHNIAEACGDESTEDLLWRVPVSNKPSALLKRYVSSFKSAPFNSNSVDNLIRSAWAASWYPFTFDLAMRFNIPEIDDPGMREDTALLDSYNNLLNKVIDCKFSSPATLRRYFSEYSINQENVDALAERGEIKQILRYMSPERRQVLLKRDVNIPYEDATKEFRRRSIEKDLGI